MAMVTHLTKGIVTTTMLSSIPVNRNDSMELTITVTVRSTKVLRPRPFRDVGACGARARNTRPGAPAHEYKLS